MDFRDTANYLKYLKKVDFPLSYLMKCDEITLDKQRRENLDGLTEEVKGKVGSVIMVAL